MASFSIQTENVDQSVAATSLQVARARRGGTDRPGPSAGVSL
jgi:hypothetical protein